MNESTILLEVAGNQFSGWKDFAADFDMESLSSTFNFSLFDKSGSVTRDLQTGLSCRVRVANPFVEDILLIDGFIVSTQRDTSQSTNNFSISGADKLIDAVDCSAIHTSQTWANKKFSLIVSNLLNPFGLTVDTTDLTDDTVIEKFTIQSGETAFGAIERLCRSEAVLPLSDFEGKLVLTYAADKSNRASNDLEVGKNVLDLSESVDWSNRFSAYIGVGQYPGKGKKWTSAMLQGSSRAEDEGVDRYRPKLFVAESKADRAILEKRVNWEAQVRSGRATQHTATVSGWFQKDNTGRPTQLWEKNKRVNLRNTAWDLDLERLITKVSFSLSGSGELTTLTLQHPDVYKKDPSEKVDLT